MARIIPKRVLEDIRFRNDIVDVVGSYFGLKRAGSSFKALCPFHKEKTPSFQVNPQRQIFHCFGCGVGGDVFKFIMQYESMDFIDAAKMLAERAGIPLELEEGESDSASKKDILYKIHEQLTLFYQRCLLEMKSAAVARKYLEKRGIPADTVAEFAVGYAPNRWDSVLRWAEKKKYSVEDVERAGLILRKDNAAGGRATFYDRFRNRLMFPIRDVQSRVIGFSGRSLGTDEKTAKYVNSPETPLFQKSRVLYALAKARRHIVESREAILCEGQIDVIRCHHAGLCTGVAAQGTAFTEDHVRIVQRYADSAVVVFDPDTAGQEAAIRTATTCLRAGLAVRIATLPPGEDPDSFIRKEGADAFRAVLENAASAISFQIDVLSSREDARSEIGLMRIAKAVLATITHSPNSVQRAKLVQEAAERLGIPATALQDDLRYMLRQSRRQDSAEQGRADAPPTPRRPKEEVEICGHITHAADYSELGALVAKYLPLGTLSDPICRAFIQVSLASAETGKDIQDLLREHDDPDGELQQFAAAVQMAPSKIVGEEASHEDAVKDLILRIWQKKFERERDEIERIMATPEGRNDRDVRAQSVQLRNNLKAMRNWEDGKTVIEFELED